MTDLRTTHDGTAANLARSSWLRPYGPTGRRWSLVCFPHAGAGASAYRLWPAAVGDDVSIVAVQLPGREDRIAEKPFESVDDLVEELVAAWPAELDPVALFGHSMGALLAYEVARALRARGVHVGALFVSSHHAPQIPDPAAPIHELDDAGFLDALRALGGMPDAVLEHEELLALVLRSLRADFTASERYAYREDDPLSCPLHVFAVSDDPRLGRVHLHGWIEQSRSDFSLTMFRGGHLYLIREREGLAGLVAGTLASLDPGDRSASR